jgi:hypothetical protein
MKQRDIDKVDRGIKDVGPFKYMIMQLVCADMREAYLCWFLFEVRQRMFLESVGAASCNQRDDQDGDDVREAGEQLGIPAINQIQVREGV